MAKSKNGGSRAMIRGRIGSDVYSVGKDGKGNRQQVIRSLAVQVSNPRTTSQMVGRMIMSTVMQGVSGLKPIIDHSFDGVAAGQPSISKFIKLNYAQAKECYEGRNPQHKNEWDFAYYQEKGILQNPWIISDGDVTPLPTAMVDSSWGGCVALKLTLPQITSGQSVTAKMIKDAWPVGADDYITLVGIPADTNLNHIACYQRIKLNTAIADSTVITADNLLSCFICEGNYAPGKKYTAPTTSTDGYAWVFCMNDPEGNHYCDTGKTAGAIVSKQIDGVWHHSSLNLYDFQNDDSTQFRTPDQALATYPVGSEQFLNGGDL